MNAIHRTVLFLIAFSGCLTAFAEENSPALTLEQAVRLALERNHEVLISEQETNELKGKIREVRSGAYPQVSLQGYGLRLRDPSILNSSSFDKVPKDFRQLLVPSANNMFDLNINFKQPLYNAGKVRTAVRLAEESLEEKNASSESVRRQVIFKVFKAFHDLLLAEANQEVVRETYRQRVKHLEQARARFDSGVATEIDVLRSEVNVANLEPELIQAENQIRLARAALNNLIVEDLEAPTRVAGSLEYRPWLPGPLEDLLQRTMELRPELQAARRQVSQARLMLSLAQAERKLSVDLEGQYGYAVREPKNLFNNDFSRWNFTFSFRLPFIDSGRKSGLIAQALARLRAAEQRLALLENNVKLEVKQAYDDMQASAKAIAAAQLSVAQAEKVLSMMEANYRYGAATTLDVVDSQTALAIARNAKVAATYNYEMAKARLRLAAGMPILDSEVDR